MHFTIYLFSISQTLMEGWNMILSKDNPSFGVLMIVHYQTLKVTAGDSDSFICI